MREHKPMKNPIWQYKFIKDIKGGVMINCDFCERQSAILLGTVGAVTCPHCKTALEPGK